MAAPGEHHFDAARGMVGEAPAEQADTIIECLRRDLAVIKSALVEPRPRAIQREAGDP